MKMLDQFKTLPQYILPQHLLSRLMFRFARIQNPNIKNPYTKWFVKQFGIDMDEALESNPEGYQHFNDFFTRELKKGARPIDRGRKSIASPVDGTLSQCGNIVDGRIFQAKGRYFNLIELLGGSVSRAKAFENGRFSTIYLSPSNYHRIHLPLKGSLREMVHIPGRLFSVSPATTRAVPGLFARNERVAAIFDTAAGPMAMVMVGAIFVGSIETRWAGMVTPPPARDVTLTDYSGQDISYKKGEEIARFNMGSTVVLLYGHDAISWIDEFKAGKTVQMGEKIGALA